MLHDHNDDFICVVHFLHFMTSFVLHIFLHFKAHCVNSVSTSTKKITINVLKKSRKALNDQSNGRIKIFVLSIFEWPFYTGFTVLCISACMFCRYLMVNTVLVRHWVCTAGHHPLYPNSFDLHHSFYIFV